MKPSRLEPDYMHTQIKSLILLPLYSQMEQPRWAVREIGFSEEDSIASFS